MREVHAAGGLVTRVGPGGRPEVLIVHRPRYDDWSFPKGKLDWGESFEEAAAREVEEETGLRCRLDRELGSIRYRDADDQPKLVRYWLMHPVEGDIADYQPNREIDEVRWVPAPEAFAVLTYEHDRALLREAAS